MAKLKLSPELLIQKYIQENKSTIKVGAECGYSAETIRKKLKKFSIERRCHAAAQTNYLKSEAAKHPTKGKIRTELECKKISESLKKYWDKKIEKYKGIQDE